MDRAAAVVAVSLLVAVAGAKPATPSKSAPTLHVRSIDLIKRQVLVEIAGVAKPPPPNFFTFTDERGRKFVASGIHCEEPFPSGTRVCDLEIPVGYERHRPVSLVSHLRGLHDKPITAEEAELASAWAHAITVAASDGGVP